jgi:hypothetical protein
MKSTQTETAHTPGPWIAQIGDKGGTIWGPGNNPADRPIAHISKRYDQPLLDETDLANGLLLASAPELLEELKYTLTMLMETHKQARGMWNELLDAGFADKGLKMPNYAENLKAIENARAAIAKAEGRAS